MSLMQRLVGGQQLFLMTTAIAAPLGAYVRTGESERIAQSPLYSNIVAYWSSSPLPSYLLLSLSLSSYSLQQLHHFGSLTRRVPRRHALAVGPGRVRPRFQEEPGALHVSRLDSQPQGRAARRGTGAIDLNGRLLLQQQLQNAGAAAKGGHAEGRMAVDGVHHLQKRLLLVVVVREQLLGGHRVIAFAGNQERGQSLGVGEMDTVLECISRSSRAASSISEAIATESALSPLSLHSATSSSRQPPSSAYCSSWWHTSACPREAAASRGESPVLLTVSKCLAHSTSYSCMQQQVVENRRVIVARRQPHGRAAQSVLLLAADRVCAVLFQKIPHHVQMAAKDGPVQGRVAAGVGLIYQQRRPQRVSSRLAVATRSSLFLLRGGFLDKRPDRGEIAPEGRFQQQRSGGWLLS